MIEIEAWLADYSSTDIFSLLGLAWGGSLGEGLIKLADFVRRQCESSSKYGIDEVLIMSGIALFGIVGNIENDVDQAIADSSFVEGGNEAGTVDIWNRSFPISKGCFECS